jgi:hypothetical protein
MPLKFRQPRKARVQKLLAYKTKNRVDDEETNETEENEIFEYLPRKMISKED